MSITTINDLSLRPSHPDVTRVKSPAPASHTESKKPQTVEEIDEVMRCMDKKYQTSFYTWIKSEANIAYVCTYKRDLFDQYGKDDSATVVRVLKWLTEGWSISSTAEIILKLFYSCKIESRRFSRILAGISEDWEQLRKEEIVNVLLVGENPSSTAKFIKHFTEGNPQLSEGKEEDNLVLSVWDKGDILKLVRSVATVLRWNDVYMMDFLIEYAKLVLTQPIQRAAMVTHILEKFESLCREQKKKASIPSLSDNDISLLSALSEATICEPDDCNSDISSEYKTPDASPIVAAGDIYVVSQPSSLTSSSSHETLVGDAPLEPTPPRTPIPTQFSRPRRLFSSTSSYRSLHESISFGIMLLDDILTEAEQSQRIQMVFDMLSLDRTKGLSLRMANQAS